MPTALNLSRTITTLDDVKTWIRDLATFNGGWSLNPDTDGAEIGETIGGEWVPTFTDSEATAYDAIWLESFNVCTSLGLDVHAICNEINPEPNVVN